MTNRKALLLNNVLLYPIYLVYVGNRASGAEKLPNLIGDWHADRDVSQVPPPSLKDGLVNRG